jgi:DNA modification methylase
MVHGLSSKDKIALRLSLNRTGQDGRWDEARLRNALIHLDEVKYDLEVTGFDPHELDAILRLDMPVGNVEENGSDIPPLSEAVSRRGDVWNLGDHRLGCGDGTDQTFVNRVLQQRPANMAFIGPPDNIPVPGFITEKGMHRKRKSLQGTAELSRDHFFQFLHRGLAVLRSSCASNAIIFACVGWHRAMEMMLAGYSCGMPLLNICVWMKSNGPMGGIYRNNHKLVMVYQAGPKTPLNNVDLARYGRNRTDYWSYLGPSSFGNGGDELLGLHPREEPVAMIADAMRDVTKRGAIVLDTFLGSGSTLMAAQETGRACCGIDLDPQYVDVSIRRWQNATGGTAVLLNTGETFAEVARSKLLPTPGERHGK